LIVHRTSRLSDRGHDHRISRLRLNHGNTHRIDWQRFDRWGLIHGWLFHRERLGWRRHNWIDRSRFDPRLRFNRGGINRQRLHRNRFHRQRLHYAGLFDLSLFRSCIDSLD
jgi:hypothetical protein